MAGGPRCTLEQADTRPADILPDRGAGRPAARQRIRRWPSTVWSTTTARPCRRNARGSVGCSSEVSDGRQFRRWIDLGDPPRRWMAGGAVGAVEGFVWSILDFTRETARRAYCNQSTYM